MSKGKIGRTHFVIPDTQVKPGLPNFDHLRAAGNYIAEKQPDVVVHLGDHWDMHSLSSYDKGTKRAEGANYQADIIAGQEGMAALLEGVHALQSRQKRRKIKQYEPEMHFLLGNHEERIERYANAHPELWGKLSYYDLGIEHFGWIVHDYRQIAVIDGVHYAHYFYNPDTGRPLGGLPMTRLKNLGFSFTMGHQQGLHTAIRYLNNGHRQRALIAGSFYQHEEHYKGPQGNDHWRGCLMCHEVKDGNYDLMEVSMNFLLKRYL